MKKESKVIILQIDDDEANRYAVHRILGLEGFDVIGAANGTEGLKRALELPDLIILDIKLPDINGFEVCRRLKNNPALANIPILQTSATFVSSDHKVEGLDSGADGYLAQPIEAAVLVATVKSLLRIRSAEKKAQEAITAREEMLAIVSHDLRNPLTAIMLQVKLLARRTAENNVVPEDLQGKLERISGACDRMNRLIKDLLDVSSIDGGKFHLNLVKFSVNSLLRDVSVSFDDLAHQAEIKLIVTESATDIEYLGDKDRLSQALFNIISNALKFTPAHGSITVSAKVEKSEVVMSVQDTGVGIGPESLSHIFDRFWQGHKEKSAGIGLGLSIVKGIVEAHNGRVWAESSVGTGSTFFLALPINS